MAEYIEREEYCEKHCRCNNEYCDKSCPIWKAPVADVAPVVHGTWKLRHGSWYCSNCGRGYKIKFGVVPACKHSFCPAVGARMDGAVSFSKSRRAYE